MKCLNYLDKGICVCLNTKSLFSILYTMKYLPTCYLPLDPTSFLGEFNEDRENQRQFLYFL